MPMKTGLLLPLALALLPWHALLAEGDRAAGERLATPCLPCHQPTAFAGRNAEDLARAIASLSAPGAAHPPTGPLSEADIADLAAFYAQAGNQSPD